MNDLIFCQRDIPKDELRYGFRTSAATGCGWIATYNALRILGRRADKEELIRCALPETYKNACMVGDRKFDMEGAKAAGVTALGVGYGYGSKKSDSD